MLVIPFDTLCFEFKLTSIGINQSCEPSTALARSSLSEIDVTSHDRYYHYKEYEWLFSTDVCCLYGFKATYALYL